jgi:hypothetical protein
MVKSSMHDEARVSFSLRLVIALEHKAFFSSHHGEVPPFVVIVLFLGYVECVVTTYSVFVPDL